MTSRSQPLSRIINFEIISLQSEIRDLCLIYRPNARKEGQPWTIKENNRHLLAKKGKYMFIVKGKKKKVPQYQEKSPKKIGKKL